MILKIFAIVYVLCTFIYCTSFMVYEIKEKRYLSITGTAILLICAAAIVIAALFATL